MRCFLAKDKELLKRVKVKEGKQHRKIVFAVGFLRNFKTVHYAASRQHFAFPLHATPRVVVAFVCCLFIFRVIVSDVNAASLAKNFPAQQEIVPPAPPPLRLMSADETSALNAARNIKQRTRLSLDFAAKRLEQATLETDAQQFARASIELGAYQAIVTDALDALNRQGGLTNNSPRDLYKRLEVTLRSHTPRLEALRRRTPSSYAIHVTATTELARRVRTDVLNLFFGSGVINDDAPPQESNRNTGNQSSNPPNF